MQTVETFDHDVRDIENEWIPLSDGCRLAARIWRPVDAEDRPVPAILEYIPYRKRDFMRGRDEAMHRYFAGHGYAAVRVDMRGSGESDGLLHDEYLKQEQDDAHEVIAWIAAQPWCDGAVGMMGKSWGGFNALQVAARRPPALKAILPVMGTDDRFAEDVHYSGGCLLNDNFWWGAIMHIFNARPPDPAIVGEGWRAAWLERLDAVTFWPIIWLGHQTRDAYWRHGSVCEDYGAIQCPVYFVGGWADLYRDTPFRLAAGLEAPWKVLVGPWAHLYPQDGLPQPAIGFLQEALRWWDQWLKGIDTGIMEEPALRVWMQESVPPRPYYGERPGRWVAEETWPSPRIEIRRFALNRHSLDAEAGPEEALVLPPMQDPGAAAGDWVSFAIPGDMPLDQRVDDGGALTFDSAPLEQGLEILGGPELVLDLAVDRACALVAVRLSDMAPDGASTAFARGVLNLTHRDGHEEPAPLEPGRRYRVTVRLHGTAYAVPPGHRLRLSLSSGYWPIVWPSPESVTLTVYRRGGRASLAGTTAQGRGHRARGLRAAGTGDAHEDDDPAQGTHRTHGRPGRGRRRDLPPPVHRRRRVRRLGQVPYRRYRARDGARLHPRAGDQGGRPAVGARHHGAKLRNRAGRLAHPHRGPRPDDLERGGVPPDRRPRRLRGRNPRVQPHLDCRGTAQRRLRRSTRRGRAKPHASARMTHEPTTRRCSPSTPKAPRRAGRRRPGAARPRCCRASG